jgi:hypothetical protein
MITIEDFLNQRRQQLIEFFNVRFGTPDWNRAFTFVSGCAPGFPPRFRHGVIWVRLGDPPRRRLSMRELVWVEAIALSLGFRPGRVVNENGAIVHPPSKNLPRWADKRIKHSFYRYLNSMRTAERHRKRKRKKNQ